MSVYPPLLLSRTSEHEADIIWDDENKSSALNGVTYEFAERVVACVNACADIPTESLTALDWQLAPKAGARPIDVAKLLLTMGKLCDALELCAAFVTEAVHADDRFHAEVKAVVTEALKP